MRTQFTVNSNIWPCFKKSQTRSLASSKLSWKISKNSSTQLEMLDLLRELELIPQDTSASSATLLIKLCHSHLCRSERKMSPHSTLSWSREDIMRKMLNRQWLLKVLSGQEIKLELDQDSPKWEFHQNSREITISRSFQEATWPRRLLSRWERLKPVLLEDLSLLRVLSPDAVMWSLACKLLFMLATPVVSRSISASTESNLHQRLSAQVRNVLRTWWRETLFSR